MPEIDFTHLAQFQPKQLQAWFSLFEPDTKYLLYGGAMGCGKSYFLRWAALGLSMYYGTLLGKTNIPIGLFSEDYPTLKDRQISKIASEFPPQIGELKATQEEGFAFFLRKEYGGGRLLLRNLDDPAKYMSTEFAGIFVEELTRNPEMTFINLRTRLRYPGIPHPKFAAATNPGGIGHVFCKRYWLDKNSGDVEQSLFRYIPATIQDNKYLDVEYQKQLAALPERLRKAYLLGDWTAFEGQFFSEFNPATEIIEPFEIPKEWELICAIDPGWGGICAAVLLTQDFDGKIYLVSSYYEQGRNNFSNAEGIRDFWSTNKLTGGRIPQMFVSGKDAWAHRDRYAVVANEATFASVFESKDMILIPAVTDRVNGWGNLRSLMPGRFFVFKNFNVPFVNEITQVITDERDPNDIEGRGNDPNVSDHLLDATRYGAFSLFKPTAAHVPTMEERFLDAQRRYLERNYTVGEAGELKPGDF